MYCIGFDIRLLLGNSKLVPKVGFFAIIEEVMLSEDKTEVRVKNVD